MKPILIIAALVLAGSAHAQNAKFCGLTGQLAAVMQKGRIADVGMSTLATYLAKNEEYLAEKVREGKITEAQGKTFLRRKEKLAEFVFMMPPSMPLAEIEDYATRHCLLDPAKFQ